MVVFDVKSQFVFGRKCSFVSLYLILLFKRIIQLFSMTFGNTLLSISFILIKKRS